jgi:ornithine cyclodeaminase/alanine dehydrogenase-like protein (mu-crystallin family)
MSAHNDIKTVAFTGVGTVTTHLVELFLQDKEIDKVVILSRDTSKPDLQTFS